MDLVGAATHIFALGRGHLAALMDEFPESEDKAYLVTEFLPKTACGAVTLPIRSAETWMITGR